MHDIDNKEIVKLQSTVDQAWKMLEASENADTLLVLGKLCEDGELPSRQEFRMLITQACFLVASECILRQKRRDQEYE